MEQEQELLGYIEKAQSAGMTKEEIKQKLLEVGWKEEEFELALQKHIALNPKIEEIISSGPQELTDIEKRETEKKKTGVRFSTRLYLFAKETHRTIMFGITILIIVMSITGLLLKYTGITRFLSLDDNLMRFIHNQLSPYFAIALVIMFVTGNYMYIYPILARRKKR